MSQKKLRGMTAYMAFSAAGYPALFIGCFSFAKQAREAYQQQFGGALKDAGYRVSRVRIEPAKKAR